MRIQVNRDSNLMARAALTRLVEDTVSKTFKRFAGQANRIEVHLSEDNGDRSSNDDKRCLMGALTAGRHSVVVTDEAVAPALAEQKSAENMKRLVPSQVGQPGEES